MATPLETKQHRRRSIRLRGYDYSLAGAYFVTVCTQGRECLFGDVVDGKMRLNDAGRMIESVWNEMPSFYPGVEIDEFAVMPNHVHGIVILVGAAPQGRPDDAVGADPRVCPDPRGRHESGQPQGVAPTPRLQGVAPTLSLPDVVHRFKTMTTKRYTDGVKQSGWPPFAGKFWQRNYYEHVIRDEASLNRIREYIANNPLQWELDRENPNMPLQKGQPHRVAPTGDEPWRV